jgi:acetyl esterase/lipase
MWAAAMVAAGAMVVVAVTAADDRPIMTAADLDELPRPAADVTLAYGPEPLQFGELRLPPGTGPHPVAVVLHGGCWLAEYDLGYMSALAAELTAAGVATWSVEYRRIGDIGGGWPGTFSDVAAATDHLVRLADRHPLDLTRVVAVGHSAGGHLALWLAARHRLPPDDPLRGETPLPLVGVVALAGIPDLAGYASPDGCGASVPELIGGNPAAVPERLARVSPIELVPLGVPQVLVAGVEDEIVPLLHARRYAEAARQAGDAVVVLELETAGHFELVAPSSGAWPAVHDAVFKMLAVTR